MSIKDGSTFHTDTELEDVIKSEVVYLRMATQREQIQMNSRLSSSQWHAEVMLTDSLLEDILIAQFRLRNAKEAQG